MILYQMLYLENEHRLVLTSLKKRYKSGRGALRSGGGRGETNNFGFRPFRSNRVKNTNKFTAIFTQAF